MAARKAPPGIPMRVVSVGPSGPGFAAVRLEEIIEPTEQPEQTIPPQLVGPIVSPTPPSTANLVVSEDEVGGYSYGATVYVSVTT